MKEVRLEELIDCTVDNRGKNASKYADDGYPIIDSSAVGKSTGYVNLDYCTKYIDEDVFNSFLRNYLKKDDLIITLVGNIGDVALCPSEKCAIIQNQLGIRFKEKINSKYMYYQLSFNKNRIKNMNTSAVQPSVKKGNLFDLKIKLHDYDEQEKIVADLDKITNIINLKENMVLDCDKLINSLYYDSIRKNTCDTKKLSEIGEALIGLTYSPKDISNEGTIVLRSSNIQNGELDFEDIVRVNTNIKDNKFVKENDILICSRNGSKALVGKSAIIKNLNEKMSFGAFMAIYRSAYNEYLISFFHSDDFRNQLGSSTTATINQITNDMLNNIVVKLPPENVMRKVINNIVIINREKETIKKDIADLRKMLKIKMNNYFGGM